jgi:apolipoprotein D and lipocalin family protein
MELDKDYQWAVIGSSSDDYLWILSRTPLMDSEVYKVLMKRLVKRGYNIDKLIRVKQKR